MALNFKKIFFCLLISLTLFLIPFSLYNEYMSTPTWGLLTKSQEDDETIEEAIDRIVAEHNADTDAHLGTDEAIAVHREADVIDHLAGSVKGDKLAFGRKVDSSFESMDGFVTSGTIYPGIASLHIRAGNVIGNASYVHGYVDAWAPLTFDNSWLFETNFFITPTAGAEVYVGIGSLNADTGGSTGIGFKIVGTTLYAYYITDIDTSPAETAVSLGAFDPTIFHNYRVIYDHDQSELRFYLDGDLVHTFDSDLPSVDDYSICLFYVKSTTTAYHNLKVADFHYSSDPI